MLVDIYCLIKYRLSVTNYPYFMGPQEDLNKSLSKIHSMIFNLAQERRLSNDELEDYNSAAAKAFETLDEIKHIHQANELTIEGAFKREELNQNKAIKYRLLLLMIGLKPTGIDLLEKLPIEFLKSILKALDKYDFSINSEIHFELILQKYRWVLRQIDRDLCNIESIKLQKKLHGHGDHRVKNMARNILMQIAAESKHIADDIRAGKSKKQRTEKIINYWYEQISSCNPFE
ncbi:MAG: hypothetical protein IPF54_21750 [Draconibacterium sp.]|nr:hypothetical protein [Draconibacterium sp.]